MPDPAPRTMPDTAPARAAASRASSADSSSESSERQALLGDKSGSIHQVAVSEDQFGWFMAAVGTGLVLLGAVVFWLSHELMHHGSNEVTLLDALVFALVSALGTGFGDTVVDPHSPGMRIFTTVYIWVSCLYFVFFFGLSVSRAMRKRTMEKRDQTLSSTWAVFLVLMVTQLGAVVFSVLEKWSYLDALYFSTVAICSVGYGDLVPTTTPGKVALLVYLVAGFAVVTYCLGSLVDTIIGYFVRKAEHAFLRNKLSVDQLDAMDSDHNGEIDEAEFAIYMLQQLGRVSDRELQDLREAFQRQLTLSSRRRSVAAGPGGNQLKYSAKRAA